MTRDELVARLKEIEIIVYQSVTLRSGEVSEYYCDIKKAFGYPDILNAIADEIAGRLPADITAIASSGYGGLPFGSVVASRSGRNFIAVRDAAKNHGKGGKIDGYTPNKNDMVAIVDDVLTTGSSIKSTMSGLKDIGADAQLAIVVVKRSNPNLGIGCLNLFDIDELK